MPNIFIPIQAAVSFPVPTWKKNILLQHIQHILFLFPLKKLKENPYHAVNICLFVFVEDGDK